MRLLFLSAWFPYPPDNGSRLRVYHLLRSLSERHDVTLISFASDGPDVSLAPKDLSFCTRVVGVRADPFRRLGPRHTARFLFLEPSVAAPLRIMTSAVQEQTANCTYDAVIASTTTTACYALAASCSGARILEEHNSMTRWGHERWLAGAGRIQRGRRWVSWQKSRRYEARLFSRFDLVTMVSAVDRDAAVSLPGYRGPVAVVPNGVDCERNKPGLVARQPYRLVYNGALTYNANYDAMCWFLADIYPQVRARLPDTTLAITGRIDGVDLDALRLDPSLQLTGFVPDIRLPVAGAAACVVPLRQGGGTRLKILEAMALGTPVVSTRKGAEGLAVSDGEHLLLADTPEEFAACTVAVLTDASLAAHLARNARRLVESQYDWLTIGARFAQLIEQAVERSRGEGARTVDRGQGRK